MNGTDLGESTDRAGTTYDSEGEDITDVYDGDHSKL